MVAVSLYTAVPFPVRSETDSVLSGISLPDLLYNAGTVPSPAASTVRLIPPFHLAGAGLLLLATYREV